ncbi:MAG: leucine-rich repeat protein [Spirochaetales bacterium]|nr:leucine-rich repeat protein [Spirochaetales bacterium]
MRKITILILVTLLALGSVLISCKQDPASPGDDPVKPAVTEYKITFDANGGEGTMASLVVKVGEKAVLSRGTFTKGEEQFTGWNTKADYTGDIYTDEDSFTPESDLTLYAQWVPANTFAVEEGGVLKKGTGFKAYKLPLKLAFPKYIGDVEVKSIIDRPDYSSGEFRLDSVKEIALPDSMTKLGKYAFVYSNFSKVTLPDALEEISIDAFYCCRRLSDVSFPDTLETICAGAFTGCCSLEEIELPSSLKSIGSSAFSQCYLLESVVIPESVTSIGTYAFSSCERLTEMVIPSSITIVPTHLFYCCSNLETVEFKGQITEIGTCGFFSCASLKTLVLTGDVTSIGASAFQGCSSLPSLTFTATTPPTLVNWNAFDKTEFPIYVPAASVDTYKAAENWSTYADRIQAAP